MYITLHVKHQSEPRTPRQPSNAQNTTGTRIPENRAEYHQNTKTQNRTDTLINTSHYLWIIHSMFILTTIKNYYLMYTEH